MATGLPGSFVEWATDTLIPLASVVASIATMNPSFLSVLAWDSGFKGLNGVLEELGPQVESAKHVSDKDMKMLYDRVKDDPAFIEAKTQFNDAVDAYNKSKDYIGGKGVVGAINDVLSIFTLGIYNEKRRANQDTKEKGEIVGKKAEQLNKVIEKVDNQMMHEAYDIAGQIKL